MDVDYRQGRVGEEGVLDEDAFFCLKGYTESTELDGVWRMVYGAWCMVAMFGEVCRVWGVNVRCRV